MTNYKRETWFLLIQYLILSLLFFLVLGCASIPELTARIELNTCREVESVPINAKSIPAFYPYMEIAFNDGNIGISSSNICFSFYLFNADRDTLYVRDYKVLGKSNLELINLLNLLK